MKRAAPFVVGLLLGVVIGYLFRIEPERTSPPPKPVPAAIPPREVQQDFDVAGLEREVAVLREALAAKAATSAESQAPPAPSEPITGSLLVEMLDADGKPVEGAWIGLFSGDYSSGRSEVTRRTGSEGTVKFPALLPEQWRVTGSHQGLACTETVQIVAGETTEVTLSVSRGGAVVEGMVREKESGPVTGAYVTLSALSRSSERRYQVQTDGEGRYRIEGVPAGRYHLGVGLGPPGSIRVVSREIVVPEGGTISKDLVGGIDGLFGTVRDAVSGAPLAGVRVSVQSHSKNARTDERGEYRLPDLMPGPCQVLASADGYGIEFFNDVDVPEEGRQFDIALRPAATALFVVTDPAGKPWCGDLILSVRPVVEGAGTRVGTGMKTDAEGRAAYRQILPGEYSLKLIAKGVGEAELNAKIEPGENTLRVQLR